GRGSRADRPQARAPGGAGAGGGRVRPGTGRSGGGGACVLASPAGGARGHSGGTVATRPSAGQRMPARPAAAIHDGNSDSRRSYSSGSGTVPMSSTAKNPTLSTRRPGRVSNRSSTP